MSGSGQSFVIELVGKEDLMNAIALNSAVFNVARILGPAIAGLVMALTGIATCFFANSISFAAVLVGLILIRPISVNISKVRNIGIFEDMKDGFAYIRQNDIIMKTLLKTAIVGTFAMNFSVLVPVFSSVILKQQETGFGFLMSFMGIGSLVGAMIVAILSRSGPKSYVLGRFPVVLAAMLILTGFTNVYILTGLCLAAAGFLFVTFSSTANSTIQLNTKDEYRGRVMSIYALVFGGSVPIGNLYAGTITNHFGPRIGFAACGAIIIVLFAILYVTGKMRKNKPGRSMPGQ